MNFPVVVQHSSMRPTDSIGRCLQEEAGKKHTVSTLGLALITKVIRDGQSHLLDQVPTTIAELLPDEAKKRYLALQAIPAPKLPVLHKLS